ncbi:MAG: copper resistance CopC/CopD family protein [Sporichthyaceae bacterium]
MGIAPGRAPATHVARRLPLALLALVAWLGGFVLSASPAAAHAQLVSSDPAANARLDSSPQQVVLRFSEDVSLIERGMRLLGSDAKERPLGAVSVDDAAVTVPIVDTLADGPYVLVYRVVSADSHPVAGTIPFTVGSPSDDLPIPELDHALVAAEVTDTVRLLAGANRWVAWAGAVLLIGVPSFVLLCWPAGARDGGVRAMVGAGLVLVVATAVASLPLQAAYATGGALGATFSDGSIPDLLTRTGGKAAVVRAVLAVVLGLLLALAARRRSRTAVVLAVPAAAVALWTFSWAGHPAVGRYPALTMADDALHLAAVCVWLGGLVVLLARLLPGTPPDLADALRRWSPTAMAAVVVLVLTGSVQAWRELQSVWAFYETEYGRWVLAKVAGLILLVVLGNVGRVRVRRHAADGAAAHVRVLRRSVAAETAVAAAVLAATAVLVVVTPGRPLAADHAGAHSAHTAGPARASVDLPNGVRAEVGIDPATPGTPVVTVLVRSLAGAVVDPPEVVASANLAAAGIEGLPIPLRRAEAGRYLGEETRFPFPGLWRITVTVRTTDVDSGVGTVEIHLH